MKRKGLIAILAVMVLAFSMLACGSLFASAEEQTANNGVLESFSVTPNDETKVPWGRGDSNDQIKPFLTKDENGNDSAWEFTRAISSEMNIVAENAVNSADYNAVSITLNMPKIPVGNGGDWDTLEVKLATVESEYNVGYNFFLVNAQTNYFTTSGWQTIIVKFDDMAVMGDFTSGNIGKIWIKAYCPNISGIAISEIKFVNITAPEANVLDGFSRNPSKTIVPWGLGNDGSEARPYLTDGKNPDDFAWGIKNPKDGTMNVVTENTVNTANYNAVSITLNMPKIPVGNGGDWDTFEVKLATKESDYNVGYNFFLVNAQANYFTTAGWQTIVVKFDDMAVMGDFTSGDINKIWVKVYCQNISGIAISEIKFINLTKPEANVLERFESEPNGTSVLWGLGDSNDQIKPFLTKDENGNDSAWGFTRTTSSEMNIVAENTVNTADYNAVSITLKTPKVPVGNGGDWDTFEVKLATKESEYNVGYNFFLVNTQVNYFTTAGWQTVIVKFDEMTVMGDFTSGNIGKIWIKAYCPNISGIAISEIKFVTVEEAPAGSFESFSSSNADKIAWSDCKQEVVEVDGKKGWKICDTSNKEVNAKAEYSVNSTEFNAIQLSLYLSEAISSSDAITFKVCEKDSNWQKGYSYYLHLHPELTIGWQTLTIFYKDMTVEGDFAGGVIDLFYFKIFTNVQVILDEIKFVTAVDNTANSEEELKELLASDVEEIVIDGTIALTSALNVARNVTLTGVNNAELVYNVTNECGLFDVTALKAQASVVISANATINNLTIKGKGNCGLYVTETGSLVGENVVVSDFAVCQAVVDGAISGVTFNGGVYKYLSVSDLGENVIVVNEEKNDYQTIDVASLFENVNYSVKSITVDGQEWTDKEQIALTKACVIAIVADVTIAEYSPLSCTINIVVNDKVAPIVTLKEGVVLEVEEGASINVLDMINYVDETTGNAQLVVEVVASYMFADCPVENYVIELSEVGEYEIIVSVKDGALNVGELTFVVTATEKVVIPEDSSSDESSSENIESSENSSESAITSHGGNSSSDSATTDDGCVGGFGSCAMAISMATGALAIVALKKKED